jgi:anaerobic selenocysteine-containing dehydrogenase
LLDDANPVFLSPKAWRVREALERVPFIASFGSFLDDTSVLADLILPDHSFLESWMDSNPESGATVGAARMTEPVMRPLHSTRATPDVLIEIGKRLATPVSVPWASFEEMLNERRTQEAERGTQNAERRTQNEERRTQEPRSLGTREPRNIGAQEPWAPPQFDGAADAYPFHFLPFASTTFYDGSTAHLPWLQEMPDPLTSAMWSTWIEINPRTADRLQVATGDLVDIASQHGSVRAPVVVTPGIAPDIVAMPVGQGHETFTRYATGRGSNPVAILAPIAESTSGGLAWAATRVRVTAVGADAGTGALTLFSGGTVEHESEHR